ncbi:FAD-dependent oxidoreductase [Caldimonas sp. KR1-144]|uniref:FAD-dependent oxidoreductase n=1 Tax=Caldimonas sp. KR1-144 TaxID=3400911 RepID=UPI003C052CA3
METDVLIVGAGPTGLMLACQLARRGIRPLIIDRHAGPAQQTRALGVQARTLEIYRHLGIAERAVALGKRGTGANLWAEGRRTARIPLGEAGADLSAFPFILILGQDDNERLLGERLAELGVSVQWNTELEKIEQGPRDAIATLRDPHGERRLVAAQWIAGCDGARSAVRALNGIDFPGAPYEHVFFVADLTARGPMVPDEVNVYLWQDGFHLFFPMRGEDHWRLVGILPAALRGRDDVAFEDVAPSVRDEAGTALSVSECRWFSTYRIHHRHAARFRAGRSFLLGDAAHIHSPVGAQGMNTGLQDAYNLAWKLAAVLRDGADEGLLDTYEAERLPIAQRLLATTDQAFRVAVTDNRVAGLLRTEVIARLAAFAMRRPRVQSLAFRTVSQIGIHYRSSPLSETAERWPAQAPRAGDRFPWLKLVLRPGGEVEDLYARRDDTRWTLILAGQSAPAEAAPEWQVIALPDAPANDAALARARIPRTSCFLLRPDGHIGWCAARFHAPAVARYLAKWKAPADAVG